MAKLVFDIPDNTEEATAKYYDKDGKLLHMSYIPTQTDRLKDLIEGNKLINKHTKQVIYITVHEVINAMNSMGYYKWVPDILKTLFVPVFAIHLMHNKQLINLLKETK